jgi:opacity protein-like surface antigen
MRTKYMHAAMRVAQATLCLTASVMLTSGQERPPVEAIGYAAIIAKHGAHGTLGGALAYPLNSRLAVVGELGYLPGASASTNFGGELVRSSGHAFDGGAAVRYLFPLKDPKLTPYAIGGLGFVRSSASVRGLGFSGSASLTEVGINLGGGLRYQAGRNWGIQPELTMFLGGDSFTRLGVGIYYQFGK